MDGAGTFPQDQLVPTFQSVGLPDVPPIHVPGIQDTSTYNYPVAAAKSDEILMAEEVAPPYVVPVDSGVVFSVKVFAVWL